MANYSAIDTHDNMSASTDSLLRGRRYDNSNTSNDMTQY